MSVTVLYLGGPLFSGHSVYFLNHKITALSTTAYSQLGTKPTRLQDNSAPRHLGPSQLGPQKNSAPRHLGPSQLGPKPKLIRFMSEKAKYFYLFNADYKTISGEGRKGIDSQPIFSMATK